jgi:2-polyprenyl-6-methoxyphenol hydroxylase-like FAD-dependent oxidoreductase
MSNLASLENHRHGRRRLPSFAPVVIVGGGPVGLFLSSLLSHYQIPSILLESQSVEQRFRHPAAHFLNTRTMEILTSTLPTEVSTRIRQAMPPVSEWQRFTWGRNLCDPHPLATVVHPVHQPLQVGRDANGALVQTTVDDTLANKFPLTQSLSPCTVGHLAQHTFGRILYDHVQNLPEAQLYYETEVSQVKILPSSYSAEEVSIDNPTEPTVELRTQHGDIIRTNLCLAADGAHSFIRQQIGIPWQATTDPPLTQDLYNIHVHMNENQIQKLEKFPASMLTTTLNTAAIAMVVRHSAAEYNIQIPTFRKDYRLEIGDFVSIGMFSATCCD